MSKPSCARRRPARALLNLETLEDRNLFNSTPAGVVGFGSLAVDPSASNSSQILVRFRPGAAPSAGALLNGTSLGSPLSLVNNLWTVRLGPSVSVQSALAAYKSNPSVAYAQEDYRVHTSDIPNDPQFPFLWGLNNTGQTGGTPDADIDAPEAWAVTTGSRNTVVAVIDTGVDYNHPDLKANMWVNPGEIPGNGIDDDGNGFRDDIYGADFMNNDGDPMDDNFHGTHVAGTIGALGNNGVGVAGVSRDVRIMALKFLNGSGNGFISGAIAALNYAVAKGATISNNSWGGGGFDQGLHDAIRAAGNAGHIFVAAAGNNGSDNDIFAAYPGNYDLPNIISVAATDENDALASFSNYGSRTVDIAAPGVNIVSTTPGNSYTSLSGTSMATPHVTGAVALVRSLHPDWGYAQIIDQVLSAADPVPALAGKTATGGRLNAASAVGVDFGPRVVAQTPNGSTTGSVGSLQLTFSEPIQPGTFTAADIVSFTGPSGADLRSLITGVSGSGSTFTVTFTAQTALGTYSMVIGPDIRDVGGSPMDQDRDGTKGETPGDRYTATFKISNESNFPSIDIPATVEAGSTTSSVLTINQHVTIADLNLQLNLLYPEVYDLNIALYSPRGTFVPLVWWNPSTQGRNFQNTTFDDQAAARIGAGRAPYTGSFRPDGSLSAVNGEDAFGTWELRIDAQPFTDFFNTGELMGWSLIVTPQGSSNQPPDAVNDTISTPEDTAVTVGVLANDRDPDGDSLTVASFTQGSHGTVTAGPGGITYTPAANFNGTDSFTYTVSDGKDGRDTATVSVTVTPINDAPAGTNKTVSTSQNTAYTFVAADFGFSDPNDSPAHAFRAVRVTTLPAVGSLTLTGSAVTVGQLVSKANLDGRLLKFTPAANATGAPYANFTFQVQDDGGTGNGGVDLDGTPNTITVTVTPVNHLPVADDDTYSTTEDMPLAVNAPGVLVNDRDVDGDALTAGLVSGPANGTVTMNANGSFTYTPRANFNGTDSFSYRISDGRDGSDTATVSITVTPVNDTPAAQAQSVSTAEDTATAITLAASDVDGNSLTYAVVSGPTHGTLSGSGASLTYTPFANYNGPDSFTFKANDGTADSNVAAVTVTVIDVTVPVVTPPTTQTNNKGDTVSGVLVTATDADGDVLTFGASGLPPGLVINPSTGAINGTLTGQSVGSYTVVVTATDGPNTGSATFVWVVNDPTSVTAFRVRDVNIGSAGSAPSSLVSVNGTVYFVADDGIHGQELWKSDGTAAGTVLVKDIVLGRGSSSLQNLTNVNGTLFFTANNQIQGRELWRSDGTAAGTVLVKDIFFGDSSQPLSLTNVGGTLFFTAYDPIHGRELWKSNGTATGTVLVRDLIPGSESSLISNLTDVNGKLFFRATTWPYGSELWMSDGTAAGTKLIKDINPSGNSSPSSLTNVNGTLFFQANDGVRGPELWKSDGTATGTVLVHDIVPGSDSSAPENLVNVNGTLFFMARTPSAGYELWKSNGTAAGTVLVKDINPGSGSSSPGLLTALNGTLYFVANDGSTGRELWRSDGTATGTTLVRDLEPGGGGSSPLNLMNVAGTLFFTATTSTEGETLWMSDGTGTGTVLVRDSSGSTLSSPSWLVNANGRLFFAANGGSFGRELWMAGAPMTGSTTSNAPSAPRGTKSTQPSGLATPEGRLDSPAVARAGAPGRVIPSEWQSLAAIGPGLLRRLSSTERLDAVFASLLPDWPESLRW